MSQGKCKWCGEEIWWREEPKGVWTPYEDEDLRHRHDCPSKPTQKPPSREASSPEKANRVPPLTDDEILWIRNFRAALKMAKN